MTRFTIMGHQEITDWSLCKIPIYWPRLEHLCLYPRRSFENITVTFEGNGRPKGVDIGDQCWTAFTKLPRLKNFMITTKSILPEQLKQLLDGLPDSCDLSLDVDDSRNLRQPSVTQLSQEARKNPLRKIYARFYHGRHLRFPKRTLPKNLKLAIRKTSLR